MRYKELIRSEVINTKNCHKLGYISDLVFDCKTGCIKQVIVPEAREEYIKGNLRLVLSVIKRFSGSNENVDDLFQIGSICVFPSKKRSFII